MTIASEIQRLQQAKSDLKSSIENKGVTVASTTTLDGYASLVDSISTGGTYTASITKAGSSSTYYIMYNGTKYYSLSHTFDFHAGDTITIYLGSGGSTYPTEIRDNGDSVYAVVGQAISGYEYTLPATNVSFYFATSGTSRYIDIKYEVLPKYFSVNQAIAKSEYLSMGISGFEDYLSHTISFRAGQFAFRMFSTAGGVTSYTFSALRIIPSSCFFSPGIAAANLTYVFPVATDISNSAFYSNVQIQSIDIPLVSRIYSQAFMSCIYLLSISMPQVTSIHTQAFCSCVRLLSANAPECTFISASAFYWCTSLTTISFPKCSLVSNSAFYNCTSLSEATLTSCTVISGNAFYKTGLISVSFPNCTTIGSTAFSSCSSLTTISFPVCTTVSSSAFYSCTNLSEANFPECTSMGQYAFRNCSNLASISFPKCTEIPSQAFAYCTNSLSFVSLSQASIIYSSAFQGCSQLQEVKLSACTSIGDYAFANCWNLISFNLTGISAVPTLGAARAFQSTPISTYSTVAGQYGSIYVPSSLYASFQTATNWSDYKTRMVSV